MSNEWLTTLIEAQRELLRLQINYPDEPGLFSALRQLDYLIALETGAETDRSKLDKINIGYLVGKPLADILPDDLSELLSEIAEKVRLDLRMERRRPEFR